MKLLSGMPARIGESIGMKRDGMSADSALAKHVTAANRENSRQTCSTENGRAKLRCGATVKLGIDRPYEP
jgi:hypothetical protein